MKSSQSKVAATVIATTFCNNEQHYLVLVNSQWFKMLLWSHLSHKRHHFFGKDYEKSYSNIPQQYIAALPDYARWSCWWLLFRLQLYLYVLTTCPAVSIICLASSAITGHSQSLRHSELKHRHSYSQWQPMTVQSLVKLCQRLSKV